MRIFKKVAKRIIYIAFLIYTIFLWIGKYMKTMLENVLAPRELEILLLAAMGYKSKNIAKIMFVSVATVKKTFANIYLKLNAKNKTNAVAIAILHKMIDIDMINHITAKYNLNMEDYAK